MISRRLRFSLWIALAVAIPLLQILWTWRLSAAVSSDQRSRILIGGCIAINALLLAIAVLLRTTRPDAIRLKPLTSLCIIVGVSLLLQLAALSILGSDSLYRPIVAIASVGFAAVLCWVLNRQGQSPWWAVLFAWNPLVMVIVFRALR
ncbi:MAG TPA: hypothetical protein VH518_22655 [Tepidisphaeraceae bacterium]